MANWNLADAGLQAMGGQVTATSLLTTVTAGAANTPGTWVQMHAASPFAAAGMYVFLGQTGIAAAAQNSQTLLDVGAGASGAEQILAGDITIGGNLPFACWHIPIAVGIGLRIAVRTRSAVASKSCTMGMTLYGGGGGLDSGYKGVTYGAVTSTSRGTQLTPPGTANVKGAWVQLTAATTSRAGWMIVGLGAANTTTATAGSGLIDIGMGTAASEVVIIPDIPFVSSTNEDIKYAGALTYPVSIPVGVRLTARYQASNVLPTVTPYLTLTGIN